MEFAERLPAVPGRFEMMVVSLPRTERAPEPTAWGAELLYAAFVGGAVPAIPPAPLLIGAPPPSTPLHVRDQIAAYERDRPEMKPWVLALPLSALRLVDVMTDYLEVPLSVTGGRSSDELGTDPEFSQFVAELIFAAFPDPQVSASAVVITAPRGLTHDLQRVPADLDRRAALAGRLATGQVGAVVAVAAGRVVPPS